MSKFKKEELMWLVGAPNVEHIGEVTDIFYRSDFEYRYEFIYKSRSVVYYKSPSTIQVTVDGKPVYFQTEQDAYKTIRGL
jgi:hypothetical protein